MDPESLYLQLCNLIAEFPVLGGTVPITPEVNRWLGRAAHLVGEASGGMEMAGMTVASNGLGSVTAAHMRPR